MIFGTTIPTFFNIVFLSLLCVASCVQTSVFCTDFYLIKRRPTSASSIGQLDVMGMAHFKGHVPLYSSPHFLCLCYSSPPAQLALQLAYTCMWPHPLKTMHGSIHVEKVEGNGSVHWYLYTHYNCYIVTANVCLYRMAGLL